MIDIDIDMPCHATFLPKRIRTRIRIMYMHAYFTLHYIMIIVGGPGIHGRAENYNYLYVSTIMIMIWIAHMDGRRGFSDICIMYYSMAQSYVNMLDH
ncbi:hypothetical protein DFH27DRAFT_582904, partial [Peziza echinospora]